MIYILAIVTAAALIYFFMVSKNPKDTTQTDDISALQKRAKSGDVEAQYNLAICYENGDGVKQDLSKAVQWFTQAAKQGRAEAQFNLAACYENGNGLEKNIEKAKHYFQLAAAQGDEEAIAVLKQMEDA